MGLDAGDREIVREGLNGFRLHERGKPGRDGDLTFERHGLTWKLAKIQVPERRLPSAFEHPSEGFVDALVMYREL